MIWQQRSKIIFQNSNPNLNLADHIFRQANDFFWCVVDWKKTSSFAMKNIRWGRPRSGWRKLNTDGSSLGNPGLASGGGVIRDEPSNWVIGFSRRIGVSSSFEVELWALRDGLTICVNKNFQVVEVELGAKALIDVLQNPTQTYPIISPLLDDCMQLAIQIPQIRFSHCYREANRCTNLSQERVWNKMKFSALLSPPCGVTPCFQS